MSLLRRTCVFWQQCYVWCMQASVLVPLLLVVESLALYYEHPHKHVDKEPNERPASKVDQHPDTGADRGGPTGRNRTEAGRQWHTRTHVAVAYASAGINAHACVLPGEQPLIGCGSLIAWAKHALWYFCLFSVRPSTIQSNVVGDCCKTLNLHT
jgi:hypothetical protein